MHFYSKSCEAWGDGKHDGSDFGKYVWKNYIAKKSKTPIQVECAGASHVPIYVEPEIPDIPIANKAFGLSDGEINTWVVAQANSFKPPADNSEAKCQVRTAKVIEQEVEEQKKCGTEHKELLVPDDLDSWTAERLSNGVREMERRNNELEFSITGKITDLNKITGSGCFYEKKLLTGIQVKITGQELVRVSGELMTRKRANTCIFKEDNAGLGTPPANPIYINVGLNALSYPIIPTAIGEEQNGRHPLTTASMQNVRTIDKAYTQNFALRDLRFINLSKKPHIDFMQKRTIESENMGRWREAYGGEHGQSVPTATAGCRAWHFRCA